MPSAGKENVHGGIEAGKLGGISRIFLLLAPIFMIMK